MFEPPPVWGTLFITEALINSPLQSRHQKGRSAYSSRDVTEPRQSCLSPLPGGFLYTPSLDQDSVFASLCPRLALIGMSTSITSS